MTTVFWFLSAKVSYRASKIASCCTFVEYVKNRTHKHTAKKMFFKRSHHPTILVLLLICNWQEHPQLVKALNRGSRSCRSPMWCRCHKSKPQKRVSALVWYTLVPWVHSNKLTPYISQNAIPCHMAVFASLSVAFESILGILEWPLSRLLGFVP